MSSPSPAADRVERSREIARRASLGLFAGLVLGAVVGVATSFAQSGLPGSWASLANAASPWLVAPFVAGAAQINGRIAVLCGLLSCAMEVAGYYIATPLRGFPVVHTEIAFWAVCALIGGPAFGWAGWAWRRGAGRVRAAGTALPPATFLGEGIGAYAIRLQYTADAVLFAAIGLLLLLAASYQATAKRALIAWTLAFAAVGLVLYGPVLQATSRFAFGA